jgi:hypothetical protein
MLHKCANPNCSIPFRHLREGKLFLAENEHPPRRRNGSLRVRTPSVRRIEHYWLCAQCAQQFTLAYDAERGMLTVPLGGFAARKTPRPEAAEYTNMRSKDLLGA